jgi:lysophospholipase L1-like esterase
MVYNCGVSGDTTNELLNRFKIESEAREPNIIIIAIGINDSYYHGTKDRPSVTIEKFQNNLQELVNQAKKFCPNVIFLGLTPVDENKTKPIPWETTIP